MLDPFPARTNTIVRGEDIIFPIYLGRDQFTGDLIDVSAATEIKAAWLTTAGVIIQKLLSMSQIAVTSNPNLINVSLAQADTLQFKPSNPDGFLDTPIRVEWTIAGQTSIMHPSPRCTVVNQLFPGQ